MKWGNWIALSGSFLLLFGSCAHAQRPPETLNYLPSGAEVDGRPPDLLVALSEDRFALVDPLDASVVIVGTNGQVLGRSSPLPFIPTQLEQSATSVTFLDPASGQRATLNRSADPRELGNIRVRLAPAAAAAPMAGLSRSDDRTMILRVPGAGGRRLTLHALQDGYLSNAQFLGRDARGRFYVQTTEIVRQDPIEVRTFVRRFSSAGVLIGIATVPIADMDTVPSRYTAVSRSGNVTVLVPTNTGLFFQSLSFRPRSSLAQPVRAAPPSRTPIRATVHQVSKIEGSEEAAPAPAAAIAPISRSQILARAATYLNVNWTMREGNFTRAGIENRCAKQDHKYWLRPRRFTEASINQTFQSMPYKWGGDDTQESYLSKIAQNKLAGSVCTCREAQFDYCMVSEAAGVDCSGFVSACWNMPKHGTSTLSQIATPLSSLSQLRPGDALNLPGSHVRLFTGFKAGASQIFQVIESATNLRCEGVCRSEYTADQLAGYRPMRFKGVQD